MVTPYFAPEYEIFIKVTCYHYLLHSYEHFNSPKCFSSSFSLAMDEQNFSMHIASDKRTASEKGQATREFIISISSTLSH